MTPLRLLGLAGALAAVALPLAQAQDVRAIQAREARRTDERTLAYFEKFRAALTAKAGADPLLSMLVFDEQEAQALVHASRDASAEHVIYQQGAWIEDVLNGQPASALLLSFAACILIGVLMFTSGALMFRRRFA